MIQVEFTVPKEMWLSSNQRDHWAVKSERTRYLRELAAAKGRGIGPLGTTHVAAFIGYPRNGRADPSNAHPTTKALIDGLTDAGVWPDDDSTHVLGPTHLRDPSTGQPGTYRVRLVLTELVLAGQDAPF